MPDEAVLDTVSEAFIIIPDAISTSSTAPAPESFVILSFLKIRDRWNGRWKEDVPNVVPGSMGAAPKETKPKPVPNVTVLTIDSVNINLFNVEVPNDKVDCTDSKL